MGERIGLARAGSGDNQQRRRTVGFADAMLDGAALGVVQLAVRGGVGRGAANHRGRHARQHSCFAFCSQGAIVVDLWAQALAATPFRAGALFTSTLEPGLPADVGTVVLLPTLASAPCGALTPPTPHPAPEVSPTPPRLPRVPVPTT